MKIVIGGSCPSTTDDLGDEKFFTSFCEDARRVFQKPSISALVRHPSKEFEKQFDVKSYTEFLILKIKKIVLGSFSMVLILMIRMSV